MTARVFADTNVLVYAIDASEGDKHRRANEWMAALWKTRSGRLSAQVLNEFYVTVTQKLAPGLDRDAARREVRLFSSWNPVSLDETLIESAWRIQDRWSVSFWDALIVSAAHAAACSQLLTEDLEDGEDFDGLTVWSPFTHQPSSLPAT